MALSFRWERCHSAVPSYTVDIFAWPESVGNYLSLTQFVLKDSASHAAESLQLKNLSSQLTCLSCVFVHHSAIVFGPLGRRTVRDEVCQARQCTQASGSNGQMDTAIAGMGEGAIWVPRAHLHAGWH